MMLGSLFHIFCQSLTRTKQLHNIVDTELCQHTPHNNTVRLLHSVSDLFCMIMFYFFVLFLFYNINFIYKPSFDACVTDKKKIEK